MWHYPMTIDGQKKTIWMVNVDDDYNSLHLNSFSIQVLGVVHPINTLFLPNDLGNKWLLILYKLYLWEFLVYYYANRKKIDGYNFNLSYINNKYNIN